MRPDWRQLARRARRAVAGSALDPRLAELRSPADVASLSRQALEEACTRRAQAVYMGGNVALCRLLGRYKAYLDTRDVSVCAHLLLDGYWEMWLTQFIARFVRRGWSVADVGAHYGYYTLLLADLVGPEGRVLAVEPNPEAARLLRRSIIVNGFDTRVDLREVAAGAAAGGTATLAFAPGMSGGAGIEEVMPRHGADLVRTEVPLTSLDALVLPDRPLDFVKIDAEGSEQRIVEGMEAIFSRGLPHMVLEFNPKRYDDARAFLGRLVRLYGSLRAVDPDGYPSAVDPERVLAVPEEWLLFLSSS
jgi:FkbM family methyltransferase